MTTRTGHRLYPLLALAALSLCAMAHADDLSAASYRSTVVTSASAASAVDATNASADSTNYRTLFAQGQPTATTDQQLTAASCKLSGGRVYLVWGLGTRYDEWIGTGDAGVETSTAWSNVVRTVSKSVSFLV